MRVCYDKLWRLLKDNKMQKRDLASAAELSSYTMTKLIFHCDIGDLMEIREDD